GGHGPGGRRGAAPGGAPAAPPDAEFLTRRDVALPRGVSVSRPPAAGPSRLDPGRRAPRRCPAQADWRPAAAPRPRRGVLPPGLPAPDRAAAGPPPRACLLPPDVPPHTPA